MSRTKEEQEIADREKLLRAWRRWHKERLQTALEGVHRDVFERLMAQLADLRSARELVDFIAAQNWAEVDADTRLTALHEINNAICRLRERNGLDPINDALSHEPPTAYQIIRKLF